MKMELMSPAGSPEAFFEALNNGADSIYLGLKKFNARKPAVNFTIYQLKKVIRIAHDHNVKIYLTLNIDLKSNEIKEAFQILKLAKEINIDGIIIKDLGLINIINKFYENDIKIHLSTQTGITSSLGLAYAKKTGAFRAVLAREIEYEELKKICGIEGIEKEIFTEGSMCFSISGRCLLSSWVGGRSGNRGVCTAPCRVLWESSNQKDNYFSMKDLSLLGSMDKIKLLNIDALKIEGRLKKASWVGLITSIYRKAVDGDPLHDDLFNELKKYSAREIKDGHLFGHNDLIGRNEEWQNYQSVKVISNNSKSYDLNLKCNVSVDIDDRSLNVIIKLNGAENKIILKNPGRPKKAKSIPIKNIIDLIKKDLIDITDISFEIKKEDYDFASSFIQKTAKEISRIINNMVMEVEKLPDISEEMMDFIFPDKNNKIRIKTLGDLPNKIIILSSQLNLFNKIDYKIDTIVIELDKKININLIKSLSGKYKIILSLPSVLFEEDASEMKNFVNTLYNEGFNNFEANSFTGLEILSGLDCFKTAGPEISVMNHLAAGYLHNLGYSSVYAPLESDISILKSLSGFTVCAVDVIVFGRIPLFQSRVSSPDFINNNVFKDKFNIGLECRKHNGLNIFLSKTPFSLIGNKIKDENIFFDNLTCDLRFFNDPFAVLRDVFNGRFNEKNTSSFNYYRKLV